jgi:hypothetical protein
MPYRLCTFDSFGRLTSVSPTSYSDNTELVAETTGINSLVHAFVGENVLPKNLLIDSLVDADDNQLPTTVGLTTRFAAVGGAEAYDPRSEVTLLMDYPYPNISYGTRIMQDLTKATAICNAYAPQTKPYHSSTQKKFGPSSGKFTKDNTGLTGGLIYVTNLSKTTYIGGYTAPHNNIAVLGVPSYAVECFFYPTSTASNFTLVQKGPVGTAANWKIGYDSSAGFLQFAWQSYGSSGGYNYSQNIINTAGLTTNTWHHVAVALVKNGAGVCYQMSGYFNGSNKFSVGVTVSTFPETRYSGGLYIGNNNLATEGFDGYIDSLRVLESGVTSGLFGPSGYGFLPFAGGTLGVPTLMGFTKNSETCVLMNFNGNDNSSQFYAESTEYVAGTAVTISDVFVPAGGTIEAYYAQVGMKDVVRYTKDVTGATGLSDATGFSANYGAIVNPYINLAVAGTSAYYNHGYDYPFAIYQVYDNNPVLNVFATNYRNDILFNRNLELLTTIEGCSGNKGSSGSIYNPQAGQNPFRRLFATNGGASYGSGANHNSLFLNPLDTTTMKYIMDNGYLATQGICLASYTFTDARGINRKLSATEISNLRLDILEYQNNIKNASTTAINTIKSAASKNEMISAKITKSTGYSSGGIITAAE